MHRQEFQAHHGHQGVPRRAWWQAAGELPEAQQAGRARRRREGLHVDDHRSRRGDGVRPFSAWQGGRRL
eukprot:2812969-Pleurochrysis_carterae.AAC.1